MDLLQSIILGLIQGITEWLPISSTGHLRLAEYFFNLSPPLLFDVVLHVGTLLVTIIFFRQTIINVLKALWHRDFHTGDGKLILPIIIGTIPTALIAVFVGTDLDAYFSTLLLLGVGFVAGGIVLFASKLGKERTDQISIPAALLIGVMQGISIIPSISRSGLTIAVALLLGIKKEIGFKYSFVLSIPAVVGALGFELYQQPGALSLSGISILDVAAAVLVTIAISFVALKILWKTLAANKFYLWAIYCFIIGAVLIALQFLGF